MHVDFLAIQRPSSRLTLEPQGLSLCLFTVWNFDQISASIIEEHGSTANVARIIQSRPDNDVGFQVKVLTAFQVVPLSLASGHARAS